MLSLAARFCSRLTAGKAFSSVHNDQLRQALAYCVQQVRQTDYENYVWCAQLPKAVRPAIFALRAFNVETGSISETVTQPPLQQIRFQWWRDAVNSILTNQPVKHPVIKALSQVSLGLPERYHLQRIVRTREEDALRSSPPQTLDDLEAYAEGTASQLLLLQCKAVASVSPDADHAASHLGKAVGLAALLRGTHHHAFRRRCYLPVDLCARERVSQEDIYRGRASERLSNVVFEVAVRAKAHLDQARALRPKIAHAAISQMMPAVATGLYLQALEKHQFNVFHSALRQGGFTPLWYQLKLKYCLVFNTF